MNKPLLKLLLSKEIGEMMIEGWKEIKLCSVGRVVTGKTPPTKNKEYYGKSKYCFITPTDISNQRFIHETQRTISSFGYEEFSNKFVASNSVGVTCIGSDMGKVFINSSIATFNQQINFITDIHPSYDFMFLYYLLKTKQTLLKRLASAGSTMPNLNKSTFENLAFLFPPLPEQKAIAKVLSTLDYRIENLRKQNRVLEDIAQTLFKRWFVDFEFPNTEGKPYKSSGGTFKDSELGEIPVEWRVGRLGEFAFLKSGYAFKSESFCSNGINKALKIKDLKGMGVVETTLATPITDEIAVNEKVRKYKLKSGDIVIAMSGNTTGKIGIIPKTTSPLFLNQRVGKLFFNDNRYREFVYLFLMSGSYEDKILKMGYGSAQPNISPDQIDNLRIVKPSDVVLDKFVIVASKIYNKNIISLQTIEFLIRTRDMLLPKLINGTIRIK